MQELISSIWLPALIGVLGFIGKSLYDIFLSMRNKKIEILENKLQKFYWPILIRIEKDNAIWESILSKRDNTDSLQYKLAYIIEKNYVLQNHNEILEIISSNMHLAEPDKELTDSIRKYIKNVTIYKAIRDSGEEKVFPLELGAEWPQDLYKLIQNRTEKYQKELNSKILK
jgi:flagellar biosynthesis component FlhA